MVSLISTNRRRLYIAIAVALAVWAAALVVLNLTLIPDVYWYSYYAIDYSLGFVRRGLGGELVNLLPGDNAFAAQRIGRWVCSVVFYIALAALAWWIAVRSGRSERRVQLALLLVVLPFGFAFGLLQAGSTLFGGTALILFGLAVARARSDRAVLITCAVFGAALIVLVLVHEAIPLLFGLGVVAVLAVLASGLDTKSFLVGCALALGPGLATAAVVAVAGKHGIGDQLCALIPHALVNNPLAGKPSFDQLINGYTYYDDYHAWACRNITPFYNRDLLDGIRYVGRLGPAGMIVNTVYGIGVFALAIAAIAWVSGVPPQRMRALLRRRLPFVVLAALMAVPVFATGVDWVRWWVSLSLDIGVVYLIFASRQPEMDAPPTRRSTRAFVLLVIGLALFPVGIVPAFLAPLPI